VTLARMTSEKRTSSIFSTTLKMLEDPDSVIDTNLRSKRSSTKTTTTMKRRKMVIKKTPFQT
jgi:hypothetical protein